MLSISIAMISCIFCGWLGACGGSALVTLVSLILIYQNFSSSYFLFFHLSALSTLMIFLSSLLCFLSIYSTCGEKGSVYLFCILVLGSILLLSFGSSNLLLFYVFFEASLLPTLALIIGWGYQPERLQAGSAMMLYTVAASLPLLVLIIWRCWDKATMSTYLLSLSPGYFFPVVIIFLVFGAFLVKLPMYSAHLWLPKAHVEAPLAGSMLLAGILLKLGGYGLAQMSSCFSLCNLKSSGSLILSVSMWGGLIATMMCLCQVDMKALVAYSSVGHMGIVSSGILIDSEWGVSSAMITMFAHGICSPALFCLTYFTYEKCNTRNIPYMGGLLSFYPVLSMAWFVFCCVNMAAPPTLNLVGELVIFPALWAGSIFLIVIMGLLVFFSASYNMYLYTSLNHGNSNPLMNSSSGVTFNQSSSLVYHLLPLILVFKMDLFIF